MPEPTQYRIINRQTQRIELAAPILKDGQTQRQAGKPVQKRLTLGSSLDARKEGVTQPDQVVDGEFWRTLRQQKIVAGMVEKHLIDEYALS